LEFGISFTYNFVVSIFFALLTLIGWGTGDIFVTLASRRLGNVKAYFWGFFIALIIASLYIPFAGPIVDYKMFALAILLNGMHTLGNLSYFRALEVGNASVVGSITGGHPLITVLIALFILHEPVRGAQLMAIAVILAGILLTSINLKPSSGSKGILSDPGVKFALITIILWGIRFAFIKIPSETIGWFWSGFPLYLWIFPLLATKGMRSGGIKKVFERKTLLFITIYALLGTILGDFAYNAAVARGFTSVVAPIAGTAPVLFVILTRFIFKEKLSGQQKLGIAFSLLGIALISFL